MARNSFHSVLHVRDRRKPMRCSKGMKNAAARHRREAGNQPKLKEYRGKVGKQPAHLGLNPMSGLRGATIKPRF